MLKKTVNPLVFAAVAVVLVVVAVLALTAFIPAVEEKGQEIKGILVSSTPDKTVYLIGEQVNYDGLRVTVTRKNGESFTVRANKCQLSGFDSSEAGYKTITVNYEGVVSTFSLKVEEPPRATPTLVGITLETLPKTEYRVDEWSDTNGGMIIREYVDGTTARITLVNSYIFGWENVDGPGEYVLTVKYMENGTLAETTYTIAVTE